MNLFHLNEIEELSEIQLPTKKKKKTKMYADFEEGEWGYKLSAQR